MGEIPCQECTFIFFAFLSNQTQIKSIYLFLPYHHKTFSMAKTWADQSTDIRKGEELQLAQLEKYLIEQIEGASGALVVEQFPSGFSNLTYLLKLGDLELVLRRPPFGAKIKSAHDMGREYKILHALSKSYSKAPRPYLYCEEESVIGAPFYVMERVQGVILRSKMPKEMQPDAATMGGIANGLIDTFVELHDVDYKAVGLGDLGKPEGYVERQVVGWTKRYFKSKTDEIPMLEKAAEWLSANMPKESSASLIHNDFKYDNVVLDLKDWTNVIAVLDWEMSTLGDPLMDLGTTLGYWVNQSDPAWMQMLALSPTVLPGNPSRTDIVQRYAEKSGRDVDNIVFYYVFGVFKIAVIAQQIYYRYKHGHTQDKRFASLIEAVKGLGGVALQAAQKQKLDNLF